MKSFIFIFQGYPTAPSQHIHLDDSGLLNPTNPGQQGGRRKSHCGSGNYNQISAKHSSNGSSQFTTTGLPHLTAKLEQYNLDIYEHSKQKRRHSSYNVGEDMPPPPPPHKK